MQQTKFSISESFFVICLTILSFYLYSLICEHVLRKFKSLNEHKNFWRFKNTFISWSHAVLASSLVITSVYLGPDLLEDMINSSTRLSYITICISMGYFIYDAVDILSSNKTLTSQSYEVLLHHVLIIFIFSVPLSINSFVGYTIAALSIEFNTVFLHLRFMLAFKNVEKSMLSYKVASLVNLVTFVVFRILTLCWMTRWLLLNKHLVHVGWFSVGCTGLLIMMCINLFLLNRLVKIDFLTSNSSIKQDTNQSHANNNNSSKTK